MRRRRRELHERIDRGRRRGARHAAVTLCRRAERQRADDLADIAGADHDADFRRRDVPERYQHRQHEGDRQRIERVEEGRTSHHHARINQPARGRYLFQARQQGCRSFIGRNRRRRRRGDGLWPWLGTYDGQRPTPAARSTSARISPAISAGHSIGVRWRTPRRTDNVAFGRALRICSDMASGVA